MAVTIIFLQPSTSSKQGSWANLVHHWSIRVEQLNNCIGQRVTESCAFSRANSARSNSLSGVQRANRRMSGRIICTPTYIHTHAYTFGIVITHTHTCGRSVPVRIWVELNYAGCAACHQYTDHYVCSRACVWVRSVRGSFIPFRIALAWAWVWKQSEVSALRSMCVCVCVNKSYIRRNGYIACACVRMNRSQVVIMRAQLSSGREQTDELATDQ